MSYIRGFINKSAQNERREKYMRKLKLILAGSALVLGSCLIVKAPGYLIQNSSESRMSQSDMISAENQDFVYVLNVGETSVALASFEEVSRVVDTVKNMNSEDENGIVAAQANGVESEVLARASIEPENRPMVMTAEDEILQETAETVSFEDKIEVLKIQSTEIQTVSVDEAVDIVKSALWAVSVLQETHSDY